MSNWSRDTVRNREDLVAWKYMVQYFENRMNKNTNAADKLKSL
ncbi:MAG: hypothetical protein SPI63_06830 [Bulleidia sp.]|nr:hypothetical protein [Bulleidia sp.]